MIRLLYFSIFCLFFGTKVFAADHQLLPEQRAITFLDSKQDLRQPDIKFELQNLRDDVVRHLVKEQYNLDQALSSLMTILAEQSEESHSSFREKPYFGELWTLSQTKKEFFELVMDPIIGGTSRLYDNPPQGYYIARFVDHANKDDKGHPRVIMSVHVTPCPSLNFQIHQWIYKSPAYMVLAALSHIPVASLSFELHQQAQHAVGSKYICSRPLKFMRELLLKKGFKKVLPADCAKLMDTDYAYERQWGRVPEVYVMVFGPVCSKTSKVGQG